jgi:hypothetical protein
VCKVGVPLDIYGKLAYTIITWWDKQVRNTKKGDNALLLVKYEGNRITQYENIKRVGPRKDVLMNKTKYTVRSE